MLTLTDCALGKDWAAAIDSTARTPTMAFDEKAKNPISARVYRCTCMTSKVVSKASGYPDSKKEDNAP